MKAKIIFTDSIREEIVANFKTVNEALQCGSLLQAMTERQDIIYYVQYKEKGITKRTITNCLTRTIPFLNGATKNNMALYFNYLK